MTTDNTNTNAAGELLKQGRLRQRLSVAECAKRTHIAPRYIEALEESHWSILPSESHRLGFLRLYCRFLGVSAEDVLALYRESVGNQPEVKPAPSSEPARRAESPFRVKSSQSSRTAWSPSSIPQVAGLAILLLLLAWVVYHAVSPRLLDQTQMPWMRRTLLSQSRLLGPKSSATVQKVRLKAESATWLRVSAKNELLYEGILPSGSVKEWTSTGPFIIKIGNIKAVSLFWNDQPADIAAGARGDVNEIRIPPQ